MAVILRAAHLRCKVPLVWRSGDVRQRRIALALRFLRAEVQLERGTYDYSARWRFSKKVSASATVRKTALAVWVIKTEGCCWAVQMT